MFLSWIILVSNQTTQVTYTRTQTHTRTHKGSPFRLLLHIHKGYLSLNVFVVELTVLQSSTLPQVRSLPPLSINMSFALSLNSGGSNLKRVLLVLLLLVRP